MNQFFFSKRRIFSETAESTIFKTISNRIHTQNMVRIRRNLKYVIFLLTLPKFYAVARNLEIHGFYCSELVDPTKNSLK